MLAFIGIDMSKEKFDACWLRDVVTLKRKSKVLKNIKEGHKQFIEWLLSTLKIPPGDILITLEPTNVYHEQLVDALHEQGFKIFLANPGKAKKFADSNDCQLKTDKADAFVLAQYGKSREHNLPIWQPEPEKARKIKALIRRLSALEKDLQREENRKESITQAVTNERVMESIDCMIHSLKDEVKKITSEIDAHIDGDTELKEKRRVLETIQGIGAVMSREMVCLLFAKSFTSAKQFAAYLGLIPAIKDSGKQKGKSVLSKRGPSRFRAKLYMPAVVASTHNPDIRAQKERLLKQNKNRKLILGAAMRKLAQICYGVFTSGKEYQPQAV